MGLWHPRHTSNRRCYSMFGTMISAANTIVYCPEGRCADFYFVENYEHSYGLMLHEKGNFLK